MPDIAENPQARKSAWIPWVFVGAMGLVVAVNGLLAWFALTTWSGLATEDSYRKGIAYNKVLETADRQKALGWGVVLALSLDAGAKAPGPFDVRADYTDAAGKPMPGLRVRAHLIRPTHEGYDRRVELQSSVPGHYQGRIDIPLPGQWDLRVVASDNDGNSHQWVERIKVP